MTHLTAHFTLDEFEGSQADTRAGLDNRVPAEMMERIRDQLNALIDWTEQQHGG